jgi:molybdopterin-guanine dinucleotide biosynthesis protein A
MTPVAVLLAGGRAQRMGGGDKPLRMLAGRTLFDHVLERVRPQVAAICLNANGDPARFAQWGLPVVADPVPDYPGPLAGVLAGLLWARRAHPGAELMLSVPTDTPFLPRDLVARLLDARARSGLPLACAASGGRTHPVVALWPVSIADELAAALAGGIRKIDTWTAGFGVAEAVFEDTPFDPFLNVNRPEELEAAARLVPNP